MLVQTGVLTHSRKRILINPPPTLKAAILQPAGHQAKSNNTQEDEREPDSPTQGSLPLAN